jgi:hypothetical protein
MSDHLHFEIVPTRFWNSHNNDLLPVTVTKITGPANAPFPFVAYAYICHLNEDIDGAPRAYAVLVDPLQPPAAHPTFFTAADLRPSRPQLETTLANATNSKAPIFNVNGVNAWLWAGVVSKRHNEVRGLILDERNFLKDAAGRFPVVHQPGTPDQGFYVSQSNGLAYNPARPMAPNDWDQDKYLDASAVPYAVYADQWVRLGVGAGDYGLAIRPQNGASSGFMFGDTGTPNRVGECSRKLVRTLSPTGFNEDQVLFLVFPGSGDSDPAAGLIKARVKFEIRKLNQMINAYKVGDKYSSANSVNIMFALGTWGYHVTMRDI